jgi:uncharacterized surface protein with fasciclin (FAS1) repeats
MSVQFVNTGRIENPAIIITQQKVNLMKNLKIVVVSLMLFGLPALLFAGGYGYKTKMSMDIVDTAVSAKSFNTLVAALKAADLVDVLRGEGPFTVFAPTDEAFSKLPEGTVENLLKPENKDKLQAILTYHVLPGRYMAGDVIKMNSAKTVNGQSFTISKDYGNVMVDNAKIIKTDIEASNGIIHVIDAVILPK